MGITRKKKKKRKKRGNAFPQMKRSPFCEGEVPIDNVPSKYTKNVVPVH